MGYKRLKDALKLFQQHFGDDSFTSILPNILRAAAKSHSPGVASAKRDADVGFGTKVQLSSSEGRALLANMILLNLRGFPDMQRLYVSSAKAAPQKILCLLAYFRTACEERTVTFERCKAPTSCESGSTLVLPTVLSSGEDAGPLLCAPTQFFADFAGALNGVVAGVYVLSGAGSFGGVADVKTPPEEVPLWEAPELLLTRLMLGNMPLRDEVFVIEGVRHVNRCATDGPLLSLVGEADDTWCVAALDMTRGEITVNALQRDGAKWTVALRRLGKDPVAVSHPPLLGVDHHFAFAMQLLCASCAGVGLRYALCTEYTTGQKSELTQSQTREAKHFEALAERMRSTAWTAREMLGLLALFPFGRTCDTEKFHAYWTRRLRDKSDGNGRPSQEELNECLARQSEVTPPAAPSPEVIEPPPKKLPPPPQSAREESRRSSPCLPVRDRGAMRGRERERHRSPEREKRPPRMRSFPDPRDLRRRDRSRSRSSSWRRRCR